MIKIIGIMILGVVALCASAYGEPATMAHGWCYEETDTVKAASIAIDRLNNSLGDSKPSVIFIASTSISLDVPTIAGQVERAFPDTPIWGATSALGIFMNNDLGYMRGSSLGLMAMCSDEYDFFVRGAAVTDQATSYKDSALKIITEAKAAYGNRSPNLILFTADPGSHEEMIIELLKEAFGRKIPVFGGSCGTEAPNPRYAIANNEAYTKGISLCFIYTTRKMGYSYQMGYRKEDVQGIATEVNGRCVEKIDGRPALEVYNEWTNGFFSDVIKNNKSIRGEGQMYHPLAMIKNPGQSNELVISLSAKRHFPETGGIEFFACVEQGDVLTVLKGDTESLIKRTYLGVAKAKRMARGRIAGGLVFYCSGARILLENKHQTGQMAPGLRQAFGDKPFMLMFHNGEHGCVAGSESFHGNLMLDAVVFGE